MAELSRARSDVGLNEWWGISSGKPAATALDLKKCELPLEVYEKIVGAIPLPTARPYLGPKLVDVRHGAKKPKTMLQCIRYRNHGGHPLRTERLESLGTVRKMFMEAEVSSSFVDNC